MNQYEAMYLFDPTQGANFEFCETQIKRLMDRAEAELVFCKRWDERRLAYRVAGRKRGVYVLTYFNCDPAKIAGIERDVKISDDILRVLILRADHMTEELMEQSMLHAPGREDQEGGREGDHSVEELSENDQQHQPAGVSENGTTDSENDSPGDTEG